MNKVILVQGPTASGKTDLAINIALALKTEIISADSRQFYNEMSIGTAKPNVDELARVKHHLINCASIEEEISAAKFAHIAEPILKRLLVQHRFAVVVGGSGMFIDALIEGLDEVPVNPEIRKELTEVFKKHGLTPLLIELAELDPVFYEQVDQRNPMRIIRALEAIRESGKPMSELQRKNRKSIDFKVIRLAIDWPREELYSRINQRVDEMIQNGLIQEVSSLINNQHLNALNTVGYKEIFEFLEGKISQEKAIELIKQHTRNYAKRQLTWLRRYENLNLLNPNSDKTVLAQAFEIIEAS
jgi:tRNA dimethylallyltransferase